MRSLLLRTVICALILCAATAAEETPPEQNTVVTMRPEPDAWITKIAGSVSLEARSKTGGTLRLALTGDRLLHTQSVQIPPGTTRIDIPAYTASDGMVEWSLGGESGVGVLGWAYDYSGKTPILAVDAFLLRELELAAQAANQAVSGSNRPLSSVMAEDLPSDWRAYAGLTAVIVMSAQDAEALSPAQNQALAQWIKWWGGVLWLIGEDADTARARDKLGRSNGNGLVIQTSTPDATAIHEDKRKPPELFLPNTVGESTNLLDSLGEIPVSFIVLSLLILGVLLGPVAYIIVRRKKNPLLFFFIVPAIAILGTAAIVGGALFLEGSGGEYNQFAVLARRSGGTEAMFYDMRGVRSGILPPELRFSEDTLVFPFRSNRGRKTLDTTDGTRLTSGWLQPRFASGCMTMRPVTSRMNIEIEGDRIINNLGFTVKRAAAKFPDGTHGYAENIPPGGSAALERESGRSYEELGERVRVLNDGRQSPVMNALLVAETGGLPYADDGGLNGTPRETEFFYIIAGDRSASEEEAGQ